MGYRKFCKRLPCSIRSSLLFLVPSLAGVLVFVLLPFLDMVVRSFFTAVQGRFCGLDNYRKVMSNQAFRLAVSNTLRFAGVGVPLLAVGALLISLGLRRCIWQQQFKAAFLFPLAVPTAALVLIWKLLFYQNGIINHFLENRGIQAPDWMGSNLAFWVLVLCYLWKNTGYTVVLWLAGIRQISATLFEAAKVDGASTLQCIYYVILPELKPVFYTIIILSFLNSFKVFREAYLVAGAYPQNRIYLLQHLFNNWFMKLDIDKMAAAAVLIAIVFAAGAAGLAVLDGEGRCEA